jgi:hypothetical protein
MALMTFSVKVGSNLLSDMAVIGGWVLNLQGWWSGPHVPRQVLIDG